MKAFINNLYKKKLAFALIFFLLVNVIYFHQIFFGKIPAPMDVLVGAYYPWLDYKWGSIVGVVIHNPVDTDVFSQFYPWKNLVINLLKNGQVPLWNPYSFSGYPLLANWQSAALYPFNLFMLIFGVANGWSLMVFVQPLLAAFFMYLYLREIGAKQEGSLLGGIVFAYSGYMVTYLEITTIAQSFSWLPLCLLLIEKYFKSKKYFFLFLVPIIFYPIVTAGSFNAFFFAYILLFLYFIFRTLDTFKSKRKILQHFGFLILISGFVFTISAVQLLPTIELLRLSIRNSDSNIAYYSFGLIPFKSLIMFLAPDFYGHPGTGNFFGYLYQETVGFFGTLTFVLFVSSLLSLQNKFSKFYFGLSILSFLLFMDTFAGKSVYLLHIPLLSTSYASRILLIFDFSAVVLAAQFFDRLFIRKRLFNTVLVGGWVGLVSIALFLFLGINFFSDRLNSLQLVHWNVSLRNILLPIAILTISFLLFNLIKKKKLVMFGLILIIAFDLIRFGLKYNTFSPERYFFPKTPALDFLVQNVGFYRVEREKTETMPPNSWLYYGLMSPSGYDSLYPENYAHFISVYNGSEPTKETSRYAESDDLNSPILDLVGVKYVMVAKRDKNNVIDSRASTISYKITDVKYKKVFEDKTVVILENTNVFPRVSFFQTYQVQGDSLLALASLNNGFDFRNKIILDRQPQLQIGGVGSGSAKIVKYGENAVDILSESSSSGLLMLTDSNYPGWKAFVDGLETPIFSADGVFRAVEVPLGVHKVEFKFDPISFKLGVVLTVTSFIFLLFMTQLTYSRKIKNR